MFISAFIWFLNALNKNHYTTRIKYPILFSHSDSTVVEVKTPPRFITVHVSGTGWKLLEKSMGINIDAFEIDLIRPTEHFFVTSNMLLPEITDRLRDLKINGILEDTIFFEYDSIESKNVLLALAPEKVNLEENHYIEGPIMTEPLSAKITGPSKQMRKLKDTFWVNLPEKSISANYKEYVSLFPLPSDLMLIEPTTATVSFQVQGYERRIERVELELQNFSGDSTHFIRLAAPVYVEYKIPKKLAAQWTRNDSLKVILNLKKMNHKDSLILPEVNSPSFLRDVEVVPKAFKVSKKNVKNEKNRNNRRNRQR
jgi:hypothetical protein